MSSKFELEKFAIQPTAEQLDICRKNDLFSIADLYQITVPHGAVKCVIKDVIYKHLVEHGVLPEVSEAGVQTSCQFPWVRGRSIPNPRRWPAWIPSLSLF